MSSKSTNLNRIYSFDIMRIVAVLAVIMIHTSAPFATSVNNGTSAFMWGNVFDSLSRLAVPLFVMISGSLMLNENRHISPEKCFKSALNIFILLVVWSAMYSFGYNIAKPLLSNEPIILENFFSAVFKGHYHMWYLFMIIGLYLITPVLRLFVKLENLRIIRWYVLFSIAICFCVPFINEFVNIFVGGENVFLDYITLYRFDFTYEYLTYYILGWYISNVNINKNRRIAIYCTGIVGLIATVICTQLFFNDPENMSNQFYSNDMINVLCYSVAVFIFLYYRFKNTDFSKKHTYILTLSTLTFGVYLIHCVYLFVFKAITSKLSNAPIEIIITFICTAVFSFITAFVMSKIPFIKKLIRC